MPVQGLPARVIFVVTFCMEGSLIDRCPQPAAQRLLLVWTWM